MRVLAYALGVVVLLIVLVVGTGYLLPVKHIAARERRYDAPPDRVFRAIATPAEYPQWRTRVRQVELLPEEGGRARFREAGRDGAITYVIEERVPDRRMVTRIADRLPFGGSWTYELTPSGSGTLLRITEHGEVYNPVFRFMSRFIFGHHHTIDGYLADLDAHLRAQP